VVAWWDPTRNQFVQETAHYLSDPSAALVILVVVVCLAVALSWSIAQLVTQRRIIVASGISSRIPGRRLFEYEGFYPIDIAPGTNAPSLNSKIFLKALRYFLRERNDRLAAMDLVFLREDNKRHTVDVLPPDQSALYDKLISKYHLRRFSENFSQDTDRLFRNVIRIVNDLGDTLAGLHCEILLHDVRNPLHSVIAARNSEIVSGRRLGAHSTRFVVQYLKNQGKHLLEDMASGSKVAYPKQFTKDKQVKATTTPVYDDQYGLVGLLCFNIDIDAVKALTPIEQREFFENYVRTFGETPEFEKEHAPSA
jgi:predicted transcriptional regulator YheO